MRTRCSATMPLLLLCVAELFGPFNILFLVLPKRMKIAKQLKQNQGQTQDQTIKKMIHYHCAT
jgi:hypothetical protein